jgi:hypothetical protein
MGQTPFSASKASSLSAACRRRSTRVNYETPVVISGRDATGQIYRDETITEIVNIHGARIRTGRRILVGMLVTVECPKTGKGSKGVCVNVYEPSPESLHPAIAIQILKPGNIWGVEDPPGDWGTAVAASNPTAAQADSSWSGVASQTSPAPRVKPFLVPPGQAAETARPSTGRAQRGSEETLAKLGEAADQVTRNALSAHEQRLAEKGAEAEARLSQRTELAATELAASVQALKGGVVSQIVEGAKEEVEARLESVVRGHEERVAQSAARFESEFAERLAKKSSEEVQASEAVLEEWLGGLMRKYEARFTELTEQALGEFAAAGQELKISAALELIESSKEALQPSLEGIQKECEEKLTQHASRLMKESGAQLAAQSAEASRAGESAFEQRVAEAMRKTEGELATQVNKALQGFEAAMNTFRAHFADDLAGQNEKAIQEAEQAVRARLAAMLSPLMGDPRVAPGAAKK